MANGAGSRAGYQAGDGDGLGNLGFKIGDFKKPKQTTTTLCVIFLVE